MRGEGSDEIWVHLRISSRVRVLGCLGRTGAFSRRTEQHARGPVKRYVPLVEFMYLVFKRMPGASNGRRLVSFLLYFCHVVRALITSLVC